MSGKPSFPFPFILRLIDPAIRVLLPSLPKEQLRGEDGPLSADGVDELDGYGNGPPAVFVGFRPLHWATSGLRCIAFWLSGLNADAICGMVQPDQLID